MTSRKRSTKASSEDAGGILTAEERILKEVHDACAPLPPFACQHRHDEPLGLAGASLLREGEADQGYERTRAVPHSSLCFVSLLSLSLCLSVSLLTRRLDVARRCRERAGGG